MPKHAQTLVVIDFGSQYAQLIARRVREQKVFAQILPCTAPIEEIRALKPFGIILSGGPANVYAENAPRCSEEVFELGVPILGIWYWCTDQVIVQRVLGAADVRQARYGALFAAALKLLPPFVFVLPGVVGQVLYPGVNAANIYPYMVTRLLPVGVIGLIVDRLKNNCRHLATR